MYWSTTRRGKKKEKEDFSALFCFSAAVCRLKRVWELSSWATHHTRDEHIQFAESRRCQGAPSATFSSCQLLSWDLEAVSCGAEAAVEAGEALIRYCVCGDQLQESIWGRLSAGEFLSMCWNLRITSRKEKGGAEDSKESAGFFGGIASSGCWNQDPQEPGVMMWSIRGWILRRSQGGMRLRGLRGQEWAAPALWHVQPPPPLPPREHAGPTDRQGAGVAVQTQGSGQIWRCVPVVYITFVPRFCFSLKSDRCSEKDLSRSTKRNTRNWGKSWIWEEGCSPKDLWTWVNVCGRIRPI